MIPQDPPCLLARNSERWSNGLRIYQLLHILTYIFKHLHSSDSWSLHVMWYFPLRIKWLELRLVWHLRATHNILKKKKDLCLCNNIITIFWIIKFIEHIWWWHKLFWQACCLKYINILKICDFVECIWWMKFWNKV